MENKTTNPFLVILMLAFFFVFSLLGKAQKTANILIQKEDLIFFKGDSLNGFPLENDLNKCNQLANAPGALYEYKYILKQKEAKFVKQKYHLAKLPYEIALEKQQKKTLTDKQIQQYRQNNPPKPLAAACNNLDFENGNFTNWIGYEGYNEGTNNPLTTAVGPLGPPPTNLNNVETSCQYFAVIANGSTDPNMGITLTSPLGGNCARMGGENRNLGDANTACAGNGGGAFTYTVPTQCEATYFSQPGQPVNIGDQIGLAGSAGEVLETTFTVTAQNSAFQYAYLFAYTDNGKHDTTQQPYFKVRVLDKNGNEINCLNYFQQGLGDACGSTHAPPGYSGSLATGLFYTTQWQVSSLNLLPYVGQPVTVIFTVAGCTVGGHFGYAYVDCACAPQQIIIPNTACIGANTTLIAPPLGNAVFQWTTTGGNIVSGATTNTVTVNQSGTYSVTITPTKSTINAAGNVVTQTLTACSYELDTTITLYPNPTVSVNSATLCTGTTATLNVTSTGSAAPLIFTWSSTAGIAFTSGDTIGIANPPATTTYTITGTSAHGCKDTAVSHVTVNIEPPPTYTAPSVCLGTPTTFSNTVTVGDTYQWNFGDTHTLTDVSTQANPSYTYTYTGNFAVGFSVTTAGGCKSNVTQTVTVNPMPPLVFTASHPCDGSAVNFTNNTTNQGSFSTWHWDFGNGDTSNVASPPAYTYTAPAGFSAAGCYSVVLTATTSAGCSGSKDTIVYVHNNPFAYFKGFEACLGDASMFVDSSFIQNPACLNDQITSWSYDLGDGTTIPYTSASLPDTIKHTYANCGPYNITLTVKTNNNCTNTNTLPGDTVFCLPVVSAPPNFSVCPGAATPIQNFTTTCANGGNPTAFWFQSLANVDNTGAPASFINPGGNDQVPSYNAIAKNMTCNLLRDSVYGVAVSGVGCVGNAVYYTANVFPTPYLSHMKTDSICANQTITIPSFTACPANSITTWTNSNTGIGLAANGTGNIGSFTGLNNTYVLNTGLINAVPTANGCIGNDSSFTIVVKPIPTMTVSSVSVCPNDPIPSPTINTNPTTGVNYSWINDNMNTGMALSGNGTPAPYTAPANNTLANVVGTLTYTPTYNGCVGTKANATVTIKPTPFVAQMPDEVFCPGNIVPQINFTCTPAGGVPQFSYTGFGGIGITQTGDSIGSFTAINSTQLPIVNTITVSATLNNCKGPGSSFNITVNPNPIANFSYTPVCDGKPTSFTDQSTIGGGFIITTWHWDMNNDGQTDITFQNPQYTITPSGTHSVSLTVFSSSVPSCTAQTTQTIVVNPNPVVNFVGVDLKGCPNLNTAFTDQSVVASGNITTWSWNFGNGTTSSSHYPQPQLYTNGSPIAPMYYTVGLTVTSDQGCVGSNIKNNYIEVYPRPIADFAWGPTNADITDPVITFVNQAVGYSGYPANNPSVFGPFGVQYYLGDTYAGNSTPNYVYNNGNFNHTYSDPDPKDVTETYNATQWVVNSYGCRDSITKPVEILPIFNFYIPNAFSPNADGKNEGFKGTGIGIDNTTYNLWVFDRWGLMIYHAQDLEKAWDGHMLGHEERPVLQEDVYVWKVNFNDVFGKLHEYHGTVTLLK
jgi:gliding motility-associated-like protein